MSNIFQLPDPDTWGCTVKHLAPGHGLLRIQLSNRDDIGKAKWLEFTYVDYFSGWTAWKGADFRIGTDTDFADYICLVAPRYESTPQQKLLETHPFNTLRLYICETIDGDLIRIMAGGGRTIDIDGKTLISA